ncbi:UDP-N-acetylglucosamine 1-carboxyvinyltransferase [Planctomicrobium sp. SH661]|uniref:UDP-N-acetylglucosamine 1-carboxyvinyltransferase n=1 Tax=Planctomicrobium sp. SH661 TaxID=3448124 RepID=UPI003F5BC165
MDMFTVQGGTPLAGSVRVSGSKNAALPIMSAALLAPGCTRLLNVPNLVDVRTLSQLLESLGANVRRNATGTLEISVHDEREFTAEYNLVRRMRASVCVLGPLLARRQRACVSLPGGCNIGNRPIDLHLKGLAALGAEIQVRNGYVHAQAEQLRGTTIHLAGPNGSTVTGTCNILSAATLARGTTVIDAAACEPEVVALADFLNQMGARISGHGTSRIVVEGVQELQPTQFEIIPDRIEAATLLIAAAITRGSITLENAIPSHLTAVLETLKQMGFDLCVSCGMTSSPSVPHSLSLHSGDRLRSVDISALPYPGIPTDVQAQFMALACTLPGASVIRDLVFPDRFMHVAELARMGADVRQQGSTAIITGSNLLTGANVMASDLRASAALVLAGLAAEGETIIRRIYHLDRGYERLEDKLTALGAQVQRVKDEEGLTIVRPSEQSLRKSA